MSAGALVIGGGPAGLAAAEILLSRGHRVTLAEQKPSLGRKLLMAGKSGLNIAKDEPLSLLQDTIDCAPLNPMLSAFDAQEMKAWAEGLGQKIFTGTSGRVFPVAMKASPLLRAWRERLSAMNVATGWTWTGFCAEGHAFMTPNGPREITPDATIFALGGASWARLGADGLWADRFRAASIGVTPFQPANMGLNVAWSPYMARYFGAPIKNVALECAGRRMTGEFVISRSGLEGGLIYALSRELRRNAPLFLDAKPDLSADTIGERLAKRPAKESLANRLRKALGIAGPLAALLREFGEPLGQATATKIKRLPLRHGGPRPMDEAISVAGGVSWGALDERLMLTLRPGMFCAGEMLDWEAPTGGYLITASVATGRWAGAAAADWLEAKQV